MWMVMARWITRSLWGWCWPSDGRPLFVDLEAYSLLGFVVASCVWMGWYVLSVSLPVFNLLCSDSLVFEWDDTCFQFLFQSLTLCSASFILVCCSYEVHLSSVLMNVGLYHNVDSYHNSYSLVLQWLLFLRYSPRC
jgi:hypothetical protein